MAQNQNPGQGNPMGGGAQNLAGMMSQLTGRPGMPPGAGAQQPMQGAGPGSPAFNLAGPPQGAPGQGPGGAKGGMQKQIAGLQGGPQPMSGPNPAMGANLAQWAAQRGPKNPNAPQPNYSNMPGITQGPASLGMGGQPGGMQRLQGPPPQGAPGQGPGGGKPQAMKQQMATLPGGPR